MTNRLELNWKLDGFVDEQRYYCSETQIDPANLPAPKAVLANDVRSYVDAAVEVGKTYYVVVGSVKNGVEKISDEITITVGGDPYKANVVALLHFNSNFLDETGRVWTNSGVSFSETVKKFGTAALFRGVSGSSLSTSRTEDFNWWAHGAYTIEAFVQAPTASYQPDGSGRSDMICCTTNGQTIYEWGFGINERNKLSFAYWSGSAQLIEGTRELSDNQFHHIAMTFDGTVIRLFADGNLEAQGNISGTPTNYNAPLRIGAGSGFSSHQFYLDEVRITPGVCRYVENFTPPSREFPNF